MRAKRLLAGIALTGGLGVAATVSAGPASANSCFWESQGQSGSKVCFSENIQDFTGMKFPNGHAIATTASSWQNTNTIFNDYAYSGKSYSGQEQEFEDESRGNLDGGIDNHLYSYDAN